MQNAKCKMQNFAFCILHFAFCIMVAPRSCSWPRLPNIARGHPASPGPSARSWRVASSPSSSGIWISIKISAGLISWARVITSVPVRATARSYPVAVRLPYPLVRGHEQSQIRPPHPLPLSLTGRGGWGVRAVRRDHTTLLMPYPLVSQLDSLRNPWYNGHRYAPIV